MLIEKVDWVKHVTLRNQRSQIYSVDLHPDGTRFATGAGDSKIKIWSTKSLTDDSSGSEHSGGEEEEEEAKLDADSSQPSATGDSPTAAASGLMASRMMGPAKRSSKAAKESPELLAVLSTHTDPVNCVRWSNKGRFLASASDDRSIIIWELRAAGAPSSAPFGSEAVQNVENWSQVFVLQGHTLNIMDVNWSPDDSLLASASLDNNVIIWPMRAAHAGERGVINPLRILSSHENQVKGVAWDPVGKYLATSAQDHTVLVWRTSDWAVEAKVTKPFEESVKQESLFRRISWSPDGGVICATNATQKTRHLAAMIRRGEGWTSETSLVGHERPVVASRFCPAIFRKKDSASGQTKHSSILALGDDSTGMLTLWSTAKERPLLIIKDVFAGGTTDLTWSRDGRLVLASSLDGTVCMLSFEMGELKQGRPMNPSETAALFMRTFGSGAGDGTVLREHALPVRTGENGTASSRSQQLQESPMPGSPPSSLPSYSPRMPLASAASGGGGGANWLQPRYKDGKKRIRPQLISSNGPPSLASASGEGMSSPSAPKRPRPMGAPSSSSLVSSSVGPRPVVSVVLERESVRFTVECPYDKAGVLTRILSDFEGLGGHGDDLMDDGDTGGSRLPLTVDVSVSEAGTGPISHIQVSTGGEVVWKEVLPGRAKTVCGNGAIVAVGCMDGSVHVLGSGGLRLCPPLMMGAAVALLECTAVATSSSGEGAVVGAMHVMAIDQAGGLRVWDVDRMRSVVNTSLRPIFSSLADASKPATAPTSSSSSSSNARPASTVLPKVIRAEVGRAGRPRLEVAMGGGPRSGVQAFVFDAALDAWMRVSDSRYVLSDFASSSSSASGGGASLVAVSTLLREEEDKAVQRELTRAHVEDRLASAVAAQAKEDVLYYLRLLTTRLAKAGQVERLRALCDRLLGRAASAAPLGDEMEEAEGQQQGDDDDASLAYWRPEKKWLVRGELSKTEALRTVVLPIMAEAVEQAAVQRLYQQYHEATANAGGGRLLLS